MSPSKRYIKYKCPEPIPRESPFVLSVNQYKINKDTLTADIQITNISTNSELLYKHIASYLYIIGDSSLKVINTAVRSHFSVLSNSEKNQRNVITCENCFDYYAKNQNFVLLKRNETYSLVKSFVIYGLSTKQSGYIFNAFVQADMPWPVSRTCPNVYFGRLFDKVVLSK